MLSIDDLTTPLTKDQVKASIYEVMATVGVSTTSWKPGATIRTMVAALAILIAAFSVLTSKIARLGFLELSSGVWLTLVAYYVYGVRRDAATFAAGEVTLVNAGGGIFTLDPGDLVVANTSTGKLYRNTSTIEIGALETVTAALAAVESGSASSASAGLMTTIVTTLLGVTCSNALAIVGLDEESDSSLKTRCLEKLGSLSPNGPWDAYAYAARTAKRSDGTAIGVTRTRISKDGYGNVITYVATATGAVSGTQDDTSTDLGAIFDAVQRKAAPLGVTATTPSATPYTVAVTYQAWVYNTVGLTNAQIEDLIEARLALFLAAQPIGGNVIEPDDGKVFVDAIRSNIAGTREEVFHVVVSLPAADLTLALNEVPVLGTVTGTITQVAPPEGF